MDWSPSAIQLVVLVPLTVFVVNTVIRHILNDGGRKGPPLPPGPTPLPFLGNTLSINAKEPWLTYTEWRAKYGDIMYIRHFGADVVVLNSQAAATDLLEKRSQIYSDRPFIATLEPYGMGRNFAFAQYGEHWRMCRRMFHQTFHAKAALAFRPMQMRRARQMIISIIDDPGEYPLHCWTLSSAVALSCVFDYEPSPRNDSMVSAMYNFLHASFPVVIPERAVFLKAFPFLLHIPDWLPGSWIKREAKEAHMLGDIAFDMPHQHIKERMASKSTAKDTMVSDYTSRMEELDGISRDEHEKALKSASFTAFVGSSETTSSTIITFILAMVKNPRAWKRAQAELDAIVGTSRLPEFNDRQKLPYIDAIVREAYRWKPLTPLGLPHSTTASDIYKGFYIPKGATVLANIWGMAYDEARYADPDIFNPDRFLDTQGQLTKDDPAGFVFGFGRRICPGLHVADASVWITIATMLATLEFNPAKDADGNDMDFEATFTNGLTLHPTKFPCSLTPRAHITKETLERVLAE